MSETEKMKAEAAERAKQIARELMSEQTKFFQEEMKKMQDEMRKMKEELINRGKWEINRGGRDMPAVVN